MTLDEKRIATARDLCEVRRVRIAESLGFFDIRFRHYDGDERLPVLAGWYPAKEVSGEKTMTPVPDYFHDCYAAVSLCEAMAKESFFVSTHCFETQWQCVMVPKPHQGLSFSAHAESFPAAVAECYGKAKSLWE